MEDTHNLTSMKEVTDIYPTGTYYICAHSLFHHPTRKHEVKQITNANDILGIVNEAVIHSQWSKGCLFYRGVWAKICDENGNPLENISSEPNYSIY